MKGAPLTSSITPSSLVDWPDQSILACAHDAGAARHLLGWIKPIKKKIRLCLGGPALEIYEGGKAIINNYEDLEEAIDGCRLLISGTSWASDLEHRARVLAQKKGIYSIAVLDHWINYKQRFIWESKQTLPNAIWVADDEAERIANREFPDLTISKLTNTWLLTVKQEVENFRYIKSKPKPIIPGRELLYLLEPLKNPITGELNNEEFAALDYWLHKIPKLMDHGLVDSVKGNLNLYLRLHPSEPRDKYEQWINRNKDRWPLKYDLQSLSNSLANADLIFGCETQALIAGIACNLRAFSTLPPHSPPCRLPQQELEHLKFFE